MKKGNTVMKITCSRLSDLIEKRDQLINQRQQNDAIAQDENKKYWDAIQSVLAPVQEYIDQQLSKFNLIQFDVDLDYADYSGMVKCVITNENRKFDDATALAWTMRISVDIKTGEVKKESNSWSGLKSCTVAQVEYLKQCVGAIEFINNLDWFKLLNRQYPNYDDYHTKFDRIDVHQYDEEILKEELKEYAESHTLLAASPSANSGKFFRYPAYFVEKVTDNSVILRETLDPKHEYRLITKEEAYNAAEDKTRRVALNKIGAVLQVPLTPISDAMFRQ